MVYSATRVNTSGTGELVSDGLCDNYKTLSQLQTGYGHPLDEEDIAARLRGEGVSLEAVSCAARGYNQPLGYSNGVKIFGTGY